MLPRRAARCLAALDDARALELLAPMGTQPTVAVLRHLPSARRQALIAGLPTAAALASTLLLGYAEDTLGAWADPDVVMLRRRHPRRRCAGSACAAPLRRIRWSSSPTPSAGWSAWCALAALLQAPAGGHAGHADAAAGRRCWPPMRRWPAPPPTRAGTQARRCRWSSRATAWSAC